MLENLSVPGSQRRSSYFVHRAMDARLRLSSSFSLSMIAFVCSLVFTILHASAANPTRIVMVCGSEYCGGKCDAKAGAEAASQFFDGSVALQVVEADDHDPYAFAQATAREIGLATSQVNAVIVATRMDEAAAAVASRVYDGGHLMAFLGSQDVSLRPGPRSYGMRISPSSMAYGLGLAKTIREFRWHRVVVLASDEYVASGLVTAFREALISTVIEDSVEGLSSEQVTFDLGAESLYLSGNGSSTESLRDALKLIKYNRFNARVVVFLGSQSDAKRIFPLAAEMGMLQSGWNWLGVGWLSSAESGNDFVEGDLGKALQGALCLSPASSADFECSSEYALAYDAVQIIGKAATRVLSAPGNHTNTQDMKFCKMLYDDALAAEPFKGMSGTISFDNKDSNQVAGHDDEGERSTVSLSLLNVGFDSKIQDVANLAVELEAGEDEVNDIKFVKDTTNVITWADGSQSFTRVPSDRVTIHSGEDAWYAVIVLVFLSFALLITAWSMKIRTCELYSSIMQESLIMITIGIVAGLIVRATSDPQLIRAALFDETMFVFILLPIIIFESGFGMEHKKQFFRNLGSILILAIPGTLFAALSIGALLYACDTSASMTMLEYMAAGALLSAVDPVATLGVFGKLGVSRKLQTLVVGESIVNDAVAIVLYRTFSAFISGASTNTGSIVAAVFATIGNLLGSALLGSVVMLLCALAIKSTHMKASAGSHEDDEMSRIHSILLILFSYLAFALCEGVHLSGIVGSLSAGLTASLYCANNMSENGKASSKWLFETLASASEGIVFFSVGLNICIFIWTSDPRTQYILPLLAIVFCLLIRALLVPLLVCCLNCRRAKGSKITAKQQLVMWNAGLRGAIAWALALQFPSQNRDQIILMATSVILFTSYVQGGSTGALLSLLGINNSTESHSSAHGSYILGDNVGGGSGENKKNETELEEGASLSEVKLPRWMRRLENLHSRVMKPLFSLHKENTLNQPLHAQSSTNEIEESIANAYEQDGDEADQVRQPIQTQVVDPEGAAI